MIRDLTHDIADKRMLLFSNLLNYERFIKARSIAYCIKNSKISNIEEARDDIYQLLNGISIDYEASDINNGIDKIIESSISKRFEEIAINKSE